jgi:predicted enzyme related to lactoylglutathione lyase
MPTGHEITLDEGVELTTRFKNNNPTGTKRAFLINKDDLTELLAQDHANGIRVYLGEKENSELTIVAVATDNEGNDIQTIVMDKFPPCPNYCDFDSPL